MTKIELINPITYNGWDDLIVSTKDYSFFHSSSWARVITESYNYSPLYFTSIHRDKLTALIPVMEINSFLTGKRGVSLPFTDYCQILATDKIHFQELMENVIDYGKRLGWRYLELRDNNDFLQEFNPSQIYYAHVINLSQNDGEIFSSFRSNTRRNIKKAAKEGVRVEISNTLEAMKAFYRLNCMTRKDHGLPPQPFKLFSKIQEHINAKGRGFIVIASHKNTKIAASLFLHFGEKVIYKYGASDRRYQNLRPNNLIMWEAIKWSARRGFNSFSFGRTDPENEGLRRFKTGWGAEEHILKYYRYNIKNQSFTRQNLTITGWHNKVFSRMPIAFTKVIGLIAYRHIG